MDKLKLSRAVIVEGRDDVRAVGEACDALIIPTHGYGISKVTWQEIEKAYAGQGIIIFTDPDHAGREIRKKLSEKFPDAVHAYLDKEDARAGEDIGIENATPEVIAEAITKALELANRHSDHGTRHSEEHSDKDSNIIQIGDDRHFAEMKDLAELGLAAAEGAAELRAKVCKELGIGYVNASAMVKKLKGFEIDIDELKKAVEKCT